MEIITVHLTPYITKESNIPFSMARTLFRPMITEQQFDLDKLRSVKITQLKCCRFYCHLFSLRFKAE